MVTTQVAFKYSHSIGIYCIFPGRGFNHPIDLTIDGDGTIYVLDRAGSDTPLRIRDKRITRFTADEQYLGSIVIGGMPERGMLWPASIAIGGDNIYVSDEALHRINILSKDGRFLGYWGAHGSGEGQFDRPSGIAFDLQGNLLVADAMNHRIQRYTGEGRFLGGWGSRGRADGMFNLPWGLAVDAKGSIYVADWGNDRIQKFDAGGKHLASFGSSGQGDGQFLRPSAVDTDGEGNIYVADWGNERVQVLGPSGRFQAKFRGESTLSKWAQDYFIANQGELKERQKANMEPHLDLPPDDQARHQSAATEKYFWGPASVKVDQQGRVFVVETCRHRVQVYQRG
jgi:DNA-binding beta-propeller fold protein YncE